ncbi:MULTISPECIES: acyl-CoA synthetase [unclassified Rhodococcus (in: high G+C Gram-positive bacteria)]|uniref:acyl-CoA synthetase n=1 Tax=unclassified Rhodococcus (in: high G+C Gram-positive bacteria) TaxID=192944 RepID=UPI001639840C|nr:MULTISPECIES: acyl-CoA synthetase [unclassified Rhodococcus (in: high G+C Gram-positive bacteria)]MBC2641321.1 acyl-CoA synthetase [Rhodococcus sp. 3A]MBC2893934.1 acyl-CoA synthetase [Rhodococcus sp. 4CII]
MNEDMTRARQQCIGDIPRRSAARFPGKLAVVHRDVRLTFAELDAVIDRVAAALHAEGLRAGDRLALLSHNCWQYPVLNFATARLGVVLVPINFMLTGGEITYILDDCAADAFVVEAALVLAAEQALAESSGTVRLRAAIPLSGGAVPDGWRSVDDWTDGEYDSPPEIFVADDDVIRIMYTSGTESRPKGAMLTSRSLMWQYISCIVTGGMSSEDVEVHALPLYHCAQLDNFLSTDIYLGATSIIVDGPDPQVLLRTIAAEQVTNLFCPPTVWISLLQSPDFAGTDLRSLRKGYYGASPLPVEILREMNRRLPGIRLWNFYGQTEMASLATALGPEDQETRGGSAGKPALNVETRIVDQFERPLPAGEVGEIVHRSPHATVGYLGQPEKTAEAFAGGWFHSGDLGYLDDDGYLWVVDRKKDMIKSGGENVATREVEETLYELDGVGEAAVFAVPHPRWIEAVCAVVVPSAGVELDEKDVVEHCRGRLAGYKVPKYVVITDSLPKNPSGKILKRVLRDTFGSIAQD